MNGLHQPGQGGGAWPQPVYGPMAVPIAGAVITALSTAYMAVSAAQQGAAQKKAADYKAQQEQVQAGQEQAASQQRASEDARKTEYVLSAARANAGASGGGVDDPSVVTNEGNIMARGHQNVLADLYTGNERAAGLVSQSGADIFEGDQYAAAGQDRMIGGFGTAIGSGLSSYGAISNYGAQGGALAGGSTLQRRYG